LFTLRLPPVAHNSECQTVYSNLLTHNYDNFNRVNFQVKECDARFLCDSKASCSP